MQNIRNVKLELLRPGLAHNQLLSPLTPYTALCGDEGPVSVHIPFEQRQLLNRLDRLRYVTPSGAIPPQQREAEVRELGELVGGIFGKVPALTSELGNAPVEALIHLRLSLSAYELALVPFELAIAPDGFPGSGSALLLQARTPIVLTREVRRGRPPQVAWNRNPRILFAFANPATVPAVPAQEHLEALRRAVEPWVKWRSRQEERVEHVKSLIVVMTDATLEKIRDACAKNEFTHVHILAHGAPFEHEGDRRYGLMLCSASDSNKPDIVSGDSLAQALHSTSVSARNCPTLVSLATCDSGNVGSVITPGGSIAHELHASGIPWVIASQFPLWMRASSVATEILYSGLLQGEDPRWVLHRLRQRLRTDSTATHDWASIVAYASVPDNFNREIEEFRNRQFRTALDMKFDKAEQLFATNSGEARQTEHDELMALCDSIRDDLDQWIEAMSAEALNRERAERLGMRAASEKRIALLYKEMGNNADADKAYVAARNYYLRALESDPHNHWAIAQYLSLSAVSAKKEEDRQSLSRNYRDWWITARQIALWETQYSNVETRAWAYSTLAELELLGTIYGEIDIDKAKQNIKSYCQAIQRIMGSDSLHVLLTRRQFQRYRNAWNRDEWRELAAAAVEVFGEDVPDGVPSYLGPKTQG